VEEERLKAILESLLFAAGEPVSLAQLTTVIDSVPREAIKRALAEMATAYASGARGIALEEVAGGYQLRSAREHALYVRKLLAAKPPRLSRPLLETVAIIAYRQPITRPEIEHLRGVDSGGVLETLLERRLVRIAGRKEAPGRPIVYATTPDFLEVFGLKDLKSLPDLEEFREIEGVREEAAAQSPEDAGSSSGGAQKEAQAAPEPAVGEPAENEPARGQPEDQSDAEGQPAEPQRSNRACEWEPSKS
jgi:segregation and condensation protein B